MTTHQIIIAQMVFLIGVALVQLSMIGCVRASILNSRRIVLNFIGLEMDDMARSIDEVLAQGRAVLVEVAANTTVEAKVYTLLSGQAQTIKDLRDQLAAAGTDPAKLEELGTILDQLHAQVQAQTDEAAAAVPSEAPPVEPAPEQPQG
jgi:hypothetical protein